MKGAGKRALALLLMAALLPVLLPGRAAQAAQEAPRFATLTDAATYLRESAERCEPVIRLYLDDLASLGQAGGAVAPHFGADDAVRRHRKAAL